MKNRFFTPRADLTFGGISEKLGEMWRGLTPEDKEKYMNPTAEE